MHREERDVGEAAGGEGVESAGKIAGRKRGLAVVLGGVLLLLATYLATTGLTWSLYFHPDEATIIKWIDQVRDSGYITKRAYPSGWFEMFRIKMWLDRRSDRWEAAWSDHLLQNGRVVVIDTASFPWHEDEPPPDKRKYRVKDGRIFNAWLYVLTVLFLYGACLEAGLHPAAAFVSGLFFVTKAEPLEFVHYCETDAALLVSMACFAWLAARAIRKRSVAWGLAGAFAAGFAVSCKFSLMPLLLWCFVAPAAVLVRGEKPLRRWLPLAAALSLAGILLACGGYLLGTPALRIAPAWYQRSLRIVSDGTYREIVTNLGGNYTWWRATLLRAADFWRHLGTMGLLPVLWGVFSWAFWFARRFRRQLAGLPWMLPLFVPFLVLGCPFVRRQELLPLSILFAMGAGLPLHWWFSEGRRRCPKLRWLATAVLALGVFALAVQTCKSQGLLSCFRLRDTRAEAQNWLRETLPAGTPVGFDAYVTPVGRGTGCVPMGFEGLPFQWEGHRPGTRKEKPRYYVENVGFRGRLPVRDPAAGGRLFPYVRQNIEDYNASVFDVRSWGVSEGTTRPIFGQPQVRLVSFERPAADALDVPIGHSRPILLLPDGAHLYDTEGPALPGPFRAIHTVGKRSSVHLAPEKGPRWLVTRMLSGDGPVKIARKGLFVPEKSELPTSGAVAARLAPGAWERIAAHASAYSTTRVRMRGDDQAVVCASYLTPSPADAARELRESGNAAAALELLQEAGPLDAAARVEAFRAAAETGVTPDESWSAAATAALAAADRLAAERESLGRTGATLCGVPVGILEDFARIKLGNWRVAPGLRLPVWLPPGHYEMSLTIAPSDLPRPLPRLFEAQTADDAAHPLDDGRYLLTLPLDVPDGQFLSVVRSDFDPFLASVEITWSPVDRSLEAAQHLRTMSERRPPACGPLQPSETPSNGSN